jgi:hypothetical protein
VVHALPGRVRVHLPGWSGQRPQLLEDRLRRVRGVRTVQANPLTGNVLIHFDPRATDFSALMAAFGPSVAGGPKGRNESAQLPGREVVSLVLKGIEILTNVLAGNPVRLLVSCVEFLGLLAPCALVV